MNVLTGLNPYGLTYYVGLQGRGTPRANPSGVGLDGFIDLAAELNSRTIEIFEPWIAELDEPAKQALRKRMEALEMEPVISSALWMGEINSCVASALSVGAKKMRFALTPILCGDRNAAGAKWTELVDEVRTKLSAYAPIAAQHHLTILIENHQDFTSRELVAFCEEFGPSIRIVFDTGNSFPVAEAPLDFTQVIAPYVAHVHLKDYRVQWTDEGYRLVRCAIGDGAVPFKEIFELLGQHHDCMTAVLEPGALEVRHVRLFTPDWWTGYASKQASDLAACLAAARRNCLPDDADYRTPWERGLDGEMVEYELGMIRRSAANMHALGFI
ncbi:MAG TPA: TIM barrel protein [Ramlibacter sp.]|jgi:sugar phosphate isomerase/epimerase